MKTIRWQVLYRREGVLRQRRFVFQDDFEKARLQAIQYAKEHDGMYEGIFRWSDDEYKQEIAKVQRQRKRLQEWRQKPKASHHKKELETNLISDED